MIRDYGVSIADVLDALPGFAKETREALERLRKQNEEFSDRIEKYGKVLDAIFTAGVFGAEHHLIENGIEKTEWCIHIPDAEDKTKYVTLYVTEEQYEAFRELLEERE